MARLYANENFPLPVVTELRRLGHDVLSIQDTGRDGDAVPDEQVLAFASGNRRTVLTLNRRHFVRLHSSQPRHEGIIVCTFDPDFAGQVRIHEAISSLAQLAGELIRVNRPARWVTQRASDPPTPALPPAVGNCGRRASFGGGARGPRREG